jgi:hypothetical protein
VFSGHDDVGEPFAILYGPRGVEWQRGAEAQKWLDVVMKPPEASRAAPAGKHGARGADRSEQGVDASLIAEGLNAAANLTGVVAQLVLAVGEVLKWWEHRQYRLMDEARFEEERRVPWTYDMMARWVKAHEEGRHLDLQISHFLGRETAATLGALADNKKMAIPQSMLYDLEQIRAVVGRLRMLLRRQFRALERTEIFNVNAVIAKAFEGQDTKTLGLNHAFLRKLASDPAEDWDRLLAANDVKSFESDVRELTRQPAKFAEKVFGLSSEKNDKKQPLIDGNLPSWSPFVVGALTGAMKLTPALVGANVLAAAVFYTYEKLTASDASRRDDFRELALFTAEVERTRILHKLWCLLDGMVRRDRGSGILVLEQGGCLTLSASSKASAQYEIIADEELALSFGLMALLARAAKVLGSLEGPCLDKSNMGRSF